MIDMTMIAHDIEVRGVEEKVGKNGSYLVVRVEDERGKGSELIDKSLDNKPFYRRGVRADFWIHVSSGKYTSIRIQKFQILNGSQPDR